MLVKAILTKKLKFQFKANIYILFIILRSTCDPEVHFTFFPYERFMYIGISFHTNFTFKVYKVSDSTCNIFRFIIPTSCGLEFHLINHADHKH